MSDFESDDYGLEPQYDIASEIRKLRQYQRALTDEQYLKFMEEADTLVPMPRQCPGVDSVKQCPRAQVIMNTVLPYKDPCDTCKHSLVHTD